jgi:hypothetical protein
MDRQYNSKKKKDKKTSNDMQCNTQKTKDWAIRSSLKLEWKEKTHTPCQVLNDALIYRREPSYVYLASAKKVS